MRKAKACPRDGGARPAPPGHMLDRPEPRMRAVSLICCGIVAGVLLARATAGDPQHAAPPSGAAAPPSGAAPRPRPTAAPPPPGERGAAPGSPPPAAPAALAPPGEVPGNVTVVAPSALSAAALRPECEYGDSGDYPDAWYAPKELRRLRRKGARGKDNALRGGFTQQELAALRAAGTPPSRLHSAGNPHQFIDQLFGGRAGFFVESGAHDGCRQSHTLWLERKRGWQGLLVEPNPGLFGRLQALRRHAWAARCCVATQGQPHAAPFLIQGALGGITEFVNTDKIRWLRKSAGSEGKDVDSGETVIATCVPLKGILRRCGQQEADIWILDTEGAEIAILRAALAHGGIPAKVVYVEHSANPEQQGAIHALMRAAGWWRFLSDPLDDWYASPTACAALGKCFEY
eukprot:TRINITY_DN51022_c0_g1_i1.p1 TRINITY_DN51022_c0_g1~~TRINITY_DN51022_c0_g1_i1.p1  ORF type:complete len:417 (+),score=106.39 TRINITY_DN51022_c0_g1_i1:44-1252(+)